MNALRHGAGAAALLALAACQLCKPTPPPPGPCRGDSSCPAGQACLAGACQSLAQVLSSLAAVAVPSTAALAPQEYQGIDGTQASVNLRLTAPQLWTGTFPLPPSCQPPGDPFEALPIAFHFVGHPFVPLLDWTFDFTTDATGRYSFALPANERFDVTIAPAVPCAAPYSGGTDLSVSGPAPLPPLPGSPPESSADVLMVGGAISSPDGAPVAATVSIQGAQGVWAGQPLSATYTTSAISIPAGSFVLPIPLAQVLASPGGDGGACAPPPLGSCDGGACPPLGPCVLFTLTVGPSPQQPALPTVQIPVFARIDEAAAVDGGLAAGPTVSLWGVDGAGLRLPVGPDQLVTVSGVVEQPDGTPLPSAEVTIACHGADGGDGCDAGLAFRTTVLASGSEQNPGAFTIQAPPNGSYVVTATPPPGLGLGPVSAPISVGDAGIAGLTLSTPAGFSVTGTLFDPTGENALAGGQVQALALDTGVLVGNCTIQGDGTFRLVLPAGRYLIALQPDDSTGLPGRSEPVDLQGDFDFGRVALFPGGRLQGSVFAEPFTGSPFPVPAASVTFYFITLTQSFGTVALPIASGLTDAEGHFSVAAPSSAAPSG